MEQKALGVLTFRGLQALIEVSAPTSELPAFARHAGTACFRERAQHAPAITRGAPAPQHPSLLEPVDEPGGRGRGDPGGFGELAERHRRLALERTEQVVLRERQVFR